jgi:hypothetical protein
MDGNPLTTLDQTPLSGWTMILTGDDSQSGVTEEDDGCVTFTVNAGEYHLAEDLQPGWVLIDPVGNNYDITAYVGDELGPYTFVNSQYATKSGSKWNDRNQDGVWDADEPKFDNWPIFLLDLDGTIVEQTTTDPVTGLYEFTEVVPGHTYLVCEGFLDWPNVDFTQTYPNGTTPAPNSPKTTIAACPEGYGPYGYQIILESGDQDTDNNFGNWRSPGCTLTQGYWKTHSAYGPAPEDPGWLTPSTPLGPNTPFFGSGQTWYETFITKVKGGNAYYILAHQYMAAVLNIENGADPFVLEDVLTDAAALLYYWATEGPRTIPRNDPDRQTAILYADILDDFNNGLLPGGPGHCDTGRVGGEPIGTISGLPEWMKPE